MHKLKLAICVHAVKPGQCPKPKNIPLCAERCFHDGQCPATQKYCPTTSGRACSEPCGRGNGQGGGQGSGYG
uniref:WAP domain-containing protein n=1 Tax=Sinocyclocheilus anshuiensis TaxID=1608454 RepID=A0A671NIV1_9TELE